MVKKITKIFFVLIVISSVFVFSGCTKRAVPAYRVDLEAWVLFDEQNDYAEVIGKYKEINPYVGKITVKKVSAEDYEKDLLDALASGNGPDIFMFHNTWLPSFSDKIAEAPVNIFNINEFEANFVDVAKSDFTSQGKIFATPLSVDSLALYYNKDLFNVAGITAPPTTWADFNEAAKKMTEIDQFGNIVRSGAALGVAENINRSTDILALLMMQNGTKMTDNLGRESKINDAVNIDGKTIKSGEEALKYYTQFADTNSPYYSWNPRMHYSIDAFYEGSVGMMLNYSWQIETIRAKNSKLNFGVAPLPQISSSAMPISYANYWGLAVSKNKIVAQGASNEARVGEAWQFLKFLTTKNNGVIRLMNQASGNVMEFPIAYDPADAYLKRTGKPAARRDLIEMQKNDPWLKDFVRGNLIAKSWYQKDPKSVESVFTQMIESINRGETTYYEALKLGETRITNSMRK